MSTLLEQAIVDAQALRDAALKNAETAILEKYGDEVRGAVESLIEQELTPDEMFGAGMALIGKEVAKESIIREKIKTIEILKYFELGQDQDSNYLNEIITKNFKNLSQPLKVF